jgi:glycosyltransferase involved in cell wall biosynthesis
MDELGAELGGTKVFLTFLYGRTYLAPLRYTVLFLRTIIILGRERPDVVYAQNPSVFCPLSCLLFCRLWRKKLIIDHHAVWSIKTFSRGILSALLRKMEKFAVARAYANTVPHSLWARELKKMGAKNILIVYDYVAKSETYRSEELRKKYSNGRNIIALAPHGGHPLERIENEAQAAAEFVNSLELLFSGPPAKIEARIQKILDSRNVNYIGFVPKKEFEGVKASVDLGLCITDEPYTLSHSLLEFAACSVPTISSAQEAVRELFGESLLYTKSSSPEDIGAAIDSFLASPEIRQDYTQRIARKEDELFLRRRREIDELRNLTITRH